MQRCKSECESIEYGVLSIGRGNVSGGGWRPQVAGGGRSDRDTRETGNRMIGWGIHFRVSGDGHRHREFRVRPFGHRELAPGIRRLKAERLIPEWPTAVAVTRHLRMFYHRAQKSPRGGG